MPALISWEHPEPAARAKRSSDIARSTSAGPAPRSAAALRAGGSAAALALQRTAGNRAMASILRGNRRRLSRCAGPCTCGGECSDETREQDGPADPASGLLNRRLQREAAVPDGGVVAPAPDTVGVTPSPDAGATPAPGVTQPAGTPPAPTTSHVCGPDIDQALTDVFVKIQNDFHDASLTDKRTACTNLHIPPTAIMAWDINDLFIRNTGWINTRRGCATPIGPDGVEDPRGCTNSVWAGGHCHLAGTVNYGMFGIVQKLCSDFRHTDSWWWQPVADMYSESATRDLIGLYKTVDRDDTGPPEDWAVATYRDGVRGRPSSGNRDGCSRCSATATNRVFDYSWWPVHGHLWTH